MLHIICKYEGKAIGFVTISNDSIKIKEKDKRKLGIKYPDYPAIKIGRLATHKDYEREGVASLMISWVVGFALELCKQVGVRFISVDSYESSQGLYTKNEFKKLEIPKDGNIPMFTDIEDW